MRKQKSTDTFLFDFLSVYLFIYICLKASQRRRQRSSGFSPFPFYLFIYTFLQLDRGGGRGAATFCGEKKTAATPGAWLYHVKLTYLNCVSLNKSATTSVLSLSLLLAFPPLPSSSLSLLPAYPPPPFLLFSPGLSLPSPFRPLPF
jgi:hypothetical protein